MRKECNLLGVTTLLAADPHLKSLLGEVSAGRSQAIFGLPSAAQPATVAALAQALKVPVLLVTAYPDRALQLAEDLPAWLGGEGRSTPAALLYPALDALPYDRADPEPGLIQQRALALETLRGRQDDPLVVVAPARALLQPLMDPARFNASALSYRLGQRFAIAAELARWDEMGYQAVDVVVEQGQYARRGGIVDVFPSAADGPIRIELFGDDIDSLRRFDPSTQRSIGRVDSFGVTAARQYGRVPSEAALRALRALDLGRMLPHARAQWEEDIVRIENGIEPEGGDLFMPYLLPDAASLPSYLPARSLIVVDEPLACRDEMEELYAQACEIRDELVGRGELPAGLRDVLLTPSTVREELASSLRVEFWTRGSEGDPGLPRHDWSDGRVFAAALPYAGRLRGFLDDTLELREQKRRVVVVSLQSARLAELYDERETLVGVSEGMRAMPERGTITLVQGSLLEGWQAPSLGLHVFTDAEIFGWSKPAPVARFRREATAATGLDFSPGDYVVHIEHGIGRFVGVEKRLAGGIEREYLNLQYAGTDRLLVPTDQLDRVTRYVGMGETTPQLGRLGSAEWGRAKARVKASVAELARELLELYSYREQTEGHAFAPDGRWQREMEAAFPYVETPDQERAIIETKADMEAPRSMDRLVCGDVGYGKTEVAMRAAFKAVLDGKQVAVLVPTTILAQQHYETFSARMGAYPVRLAVLSRFQSRAEQKATVAALASGEVDIVIGTHRLLQKDVSFKELGLLVIDEEQRFGVKHKEHLKQLRRSVDVLTLTATPIPRSLHMALVGVRDMSVIETPPEGRLPIRTYLQPFDEYHIREAILRELDRGGQVYFVHNKVQTIQAMAERIRRLVPEASVAVGHGQMPEDELERVISEFARGDHGILVCSSIIENGLDIPNVNTMIINDATHFGLAQLYQLRGRIGRGSVRAYAYLLYRDAQRITHTAERRLRAIFEATELGAGFRIAMKDLEIRGAGNLLGPEQSGNIVSVGFDLYSRLLARAIKERKGEAVQTDDLPVPVAIDLPLDMYIPSDYVEHESSRLALYQRIAGVGQLSELEELDDELRDRFGPLPRPVENLLLFVRVKVLATQAGLAGVALDGQTLTVRAREGTVFDRIGLYRRFGMEAKVIQGVLRVPRARLGQDWPGVLLAVLQETVAANRPRSTPQDSPAAVTSARVS